MAGCYVIPGLHDVFAGMNSQAQANAYLFMGVTSIVGSDEPQGRRGALFREAAPAPRVYPLATIDGVRSGEDIAAELATREVLAQVDDAARNGARVLLLLYRLTLPQVQAVVRRARQKGLVTIGELGATRYGDAIDAGVDAFVHSSRYSLELATEKLRGELALNPFGPPRTRFYEYLAQLDPDSPAVAAWGARLNRAKVALIPTLSLYYLDLPGHANPWAEPIARILDPNDIHLPADPLTGDPPPAPGVPAGLSRNVLQIEQRYQRAGARYLAGSGTSAFGTLPGISLHNELAMLVDLGLEPRQALAAATRDVGEAFGWRRTGLVQAGFDADLVVLDADPARDIRNLKRIRMVIARGVPIDREALLAATSEAKRGAAILPAAGESACSVALQNDR
ncbi:MAG: amidohydrolase family protein [Steroidobacteraceae bacterium]